MANTPVVLRNASDAYVAEKKPRQNISTTRRLYLASGGSENTRYAYLYFGRPFPLGARIVSATLRIYTGNGFSSGTTMVADRVASKWSANRVNWRNKPGVVSGSGASGTGAAGANKQWSFNVTNTMQAVSDGAAWYGFRISASGTDTKFIWSAQAAGNLRPVLEIVWSDAPEPPEDLYPDGNLAVAVSHPKLRFDFTDNVGNTDMAAAQIRIATTPEGQSVYWDHTYDTSTPEADLLALGYPGLANGALAYWWVRVKDGSGSWSDWSDSAHFYRVDPGAVSITNPPNVEEPFVSEPTPPITWTSELPQRAYQVIITDPEAPENWIWTSGKVTSDDDGIQLPPGVITDSGARYRVIVRIWDAINRVATPGVTIYTESFRDFDYRFSATVQPVDWMYVGKDQYRAWAILEWGRSTAPDSFVILRDGKVLEHALDPADVVSDDDGGVFRYVDKTAQPRLPHTWEVVSVVNGVSSADNPKETDTVRQVTTSLVDPNGSREMYFFNPEVGAERAEVSEIHYVLGDSPPVLITQSIRGYEGTVKGVFASNVVPGLSAQQQRDALEHFMRRPGTVLLLTWVDKSMKVVIRNVTIAPISRVDGTVEYDASFDFFQVDF